MENVKLPDWKVCKKSTAYSIHSRRCFATGEYCSKQANVRRERDLLHGGEKPSINAFVVMNFSDMSDVVYNWRIRNFIASLKKYLWINPESHEIACLGEAVDEQTARTALGGSKADKWVRVEQIHVDRADANAASNYVVCNRICQQMQIADLVVVDVSVENTNVFYEFGMAAAFGKLILPICYSESYFAKDREIEEWLTRYPDQKKNGNKNKAKEIRREWDAYKNHIGRFPWRKKLFEHYGLRHRGDDSNKEYCDFALVTARDCIYEDCKYGRFPYIEQVNGAQVGQTIYELLRDSYNHALFDAAQQRSYNTLVVYTMDRILNEGEAGQCIVNYYNHFTAQLRRERCFCGDRVAVVCQDNLIPDDPKDARNPLDVMYNVGDIIRIGMNQATYLAQQKKIKTGDCSAYRPDPKGKDASWKDAVDVFTQSHIHNRCVPLYTDDPIYVSEYKEGMQQGILDRQALADKNFDYEHFFCLFHVMLYTLKYTNEIVVDISRNSLQALFWLGVAHGSDVPAVVVRHVLTDRERSRGEETAPERNIFDVDGLWTAKLQSDDTQGFYRQLALAQMGIEQRAKLMLENMGAYEAEVSRQLYEPAPPATDGRDTRMDEIRRLLDRKDRQESRLLESYYRDRFWRQMLRYNELGIYIVQHERTQTDEDPRLEVGRWDVEAMSELSHYLSKRKVIGAYHQRTAKRGTFIEESAAQNFLSIGGEVTPMAPAEGSAPRTLAAYIADTMGSEAREKADPGKRYNILRRRSFLAEVHNAGCGSAIKRMQEFRGFEHITGTGACDVYAQFPGSCCAECMCAPGKETAANRIITGACPKQECEMKDGPADYYQLGQLLLWRDVAPDSGETGGETDVKFRVSLDGVSGPATLALTALLVDEEQKGRILPEDRPRLPLNSLQTEVRKILMEQIDAALEKVLNDGENLEKVQYAVRAYLTTVLYQYFLPFLSKADVDRICNGLYTYMTAPDSANAFFGEKVAGGGTCAGTVQTALRSVLTNFRGVEALYQVKVRVNGAGSDTRSIIDIEPVQTGSEEECAVSCLFTQEK